MYKKSFILLLVMLFSLTGFANTRFLRIRYVGPQDSNTCPNSLNNFFKNNYINAVFNMINAPKAPGQEGFATLTARSTHNFKSLQPIMLENEGLNDFIALISDQSGQVKINQKKYLLTRVWLKNDGSISTHFQSHIIISNTCIIEGEGSY